MKLIGYKTRIGSTWTSRRPILNKTKLKGLRRWRRRSRGRGISTSGKCRRKLTSYLSRFHSSNLTSMSPKRLTTSWSTRSRKWRLSFKNKNHKISKKSRSWIFASLYLWLSRGRLINLNLIWPKEKRSTTNGLQNSKSSRNFTRPKRWKSSKIFNYLSRTTTKKPSL